MTFTIQWRRWLLLILLTWLKFLGSKWLYTRFLQFTRIQLIKKLYLNFLFARQSMMFLIGLYLTKMGIKVEKWTQLLMKLCVIANPSLQTPAGKKFKDFQSLKQTKNKILAFVFLISNSRKTFKPKSILQPLGLKVRKKSWTQNLFLVEKGMKIFLCIYRKCPSEVQTIAFIRTTTKLRVAMTSMRFQCIWTKKYIYIRHIDIYIKVQPYS